MQFYARQLIRDSMLRKCMVGRSLLPSSMCKPNFVHLGVIFDVPVSAVIFFFSAPLRQRTDVTDQIGMH